MDHPDSRGRWGWVKPAVWGFILGLIVGPSVSGYFGWQVLADTAQRRVQSAVVDQEARTCALLAREHTPDVDKLGYGKRHDLAQQYAKLPWSDGSDYRVVDACANALTEQPTASTDMHKG